MEKVEKSVGPSRKKLRTNKVTNLKLPSDSDEDDILENSYKNSKSYNDFNEQDLEMINKINYPRRKKGKNAINRTERGSFFYKEKSQLFRTEITEFMSVYQQELERVLQSKFHCFMKTHFMNMYNIENFYSYLVKVAKERNPITGEGLVMIQSKNEKEKEKVQEEVDNMKQVGRKDLGGPSECRKVWDNKRVQQSEGR
jgi:hypothetical protein